MKRLILFSFVIIHFAFLTNLSAQPIHPPTDYTKNYKLRMWAQRANPSADSLNQNWKDIDSIVQWPRKINVDTLRTFGNFLSEYAKAGSQYYQTRSVSKDSTRWYVGGTKEMTLDATGLRAKFISQTGSVISGSHLVDGTVIAEKLGENAQGFSTDIVFSATDYNTVAWAAGSLKFSNAQTYSILAGNTGDITQFVYIYFNSLASTTVLQVTTDFAAATGEQSQILCVAKPASAANQMAFFVSAVGVLGVNETNISANSISADKIQANTITAGKLNVSDLSAITADMGTLTSGSIVVGDVTNKLWLNDFGDGALNIGGAVKANAPFKVTNTGLATMTGATMKTSTGTKRIEIRSSDNEIEFFDGDVSKVRIGSTIGQSGVSGIELRNSSIYLITLAGGIGVVLDESSIRTPRLILREAGGTFSGTLQATIADNNKTWTLPNVDGQILLTTTVEYPVTSVFGRYGAVTAQDDYSGYYSALGHNHSGVYALVSHGIHAYGVSGPYLVQTPTGTKIFEFSYGMLQSVSDP